MKRLLGAAVTVACAVLLPATPAWAHSAAGLDESNYQTSITSIEPASSAVTVKVIELGARLQLTVEPAHTATVIGYDDEPYLRVGPDGIFVNTHSSASWLNRDRYGTAKPPAGVKSSDPPVWQRLGGGLTVQWHDHRTHWMSTTLPPMVAPSPGQRHVILPRWIVPIVVDSVPLNVVGTLVWEPAPSSVPWLGGAVLIALVTLFAIRAKGGARWWVALGALIVLVDVLLVLTATGHVKAVALVAAAIALLLVVAARKLPLAEAVGGAAVAAGAFARSSVIYHSTIRSSGGADLTRVLVTLGLGIGIGVAAAVLAGSGLLSTKPRDQVAARSGDTAADRADGTAANLGGLGVGET